jgi:guanosine-3',5'-bis(diphosphate) 3'-pyrophosphohydrolase
MTFTGDEVGLMLKAFNYAADQHRCQRRKDIGAAPYINHPIAVAEMLWRIGGVRETSVVVAAILHDTVEDTGATPQDIESLFGPDVRRLVAEVTDDKRLSKADRKGLQVEHAPHLSPGAKQIKLADKIANVSDVAFAPPPDWPHDRRTTYLSWSDRVVAGLRGCHSKRTTMRSSNRPGFASERKTPTSSRPRKTAKTEQPCERDCRSSVVSQHVSDARRSRFCGPGTTSPRPAREWISSRRLTRRSAERSRILLRPRCRRRRHLVVTRLSRCGTRPRWPPSNTSCHCASSLPLSILPPPPARVAAS